MEDLVLGNGCDDGSGTSRNPLTRFVNHMLRDKSQHEHVYCFSPFAFN